MESPPPFILIFRIISVCHHPRLRTPRPPRRRLSSARPRLAPGRPELRPRVPPARPARRVRWPPGCHSWGERFRGGFDLVHVVALERFLHPIHRGLHLGPGVRADFVVHFAELLFRSGRPADPPDCGLRCTSRRFLSSAAFSSASLTIRSISASERPEDASMRMLCSLFVPMSLAETFIIPLASMSKLTSICGVPRGCGRNAVQVEPADGTVVHRHFPFALKHVHLHRRLAVGPRL